MMTTERHNIYIWQNKKWPEFTWDAERLLPEISALSMALGELHGRMASLGFKMRNKSILEEMSSELISSSEIEGVKLNYDSVRSSIARRLGIEDDGVMVEDHYVDGLVDVMVDAVKNCDEALTAERLHDWHAALFPTGRSGMTGITVADWRKGDEPMQVVSGAFGHEKVHYEAPPSVKVAEEMARLIEWCNTTTQSPFIMASVAHLWFLTIHPYDDGNGRISRTLADMLLSRLDNGNGRFYSISTEINRNKKDYYDILERTQKGDVDVTQWILWFFKCIESAIRRSLSLVERTIRKADFWDRHSAAGLNDRQRKIINRLWDGFEGKLSTSKWAKICGCSQDTALRDINDLIAKGLLRNSGESGRNANYLLVE